MHDKDQDFIESLLGAVGEKDGDDRGPNFRADQDALLASDEEARELLETLIRLTGAEEEETPETVEPSDARSNVATHATSDDAEATSASPPETPGESDSEPGDEPAVPDAAAAEVSVIQRIRSRFRRPTVRELVCGGGLLLTFATGWGLGSWRHGSDAETKVVVDQSADSIAPLLATPEHRGEPIQPILPLVGLNRRQIELGAQLFHERGLSAHGRTACVSCHQFTSGGSELSPSSMGADGKPLDRNTPTVLNVALNMVYHWDGKLDSLAAAIETAACSPRMMGSNWERMVRFLETDEAYRARFQQTFGGPPTKERIIAALTEYLRSLTTTNSRFDRWLQGEEMALSAEELDGYRLFCRFGCINCHHGPNAGGQMLVPWPTTDTRTAQSVESAPTLPTGQSPIDSPSSSPSMRVPPLRVVANSAPYFHDGRMASLSEAIEVMARTRCGVEPNQEQVRRIELFLKSLAGDLPPHSLPTEIKQVRRKQEPAEGSP
ncbi:MAG: hypothetical protein KatS3mg111_0351 [Pirellulaceae bacterium]|nr:MAG: hypothetical protein KatS3mg111_0351 [Pirellulaceae bacterium]